MNFYIFQLDRLALVSYILLVLMRGCYFGLTRRLEGGTWEEVGYLVGLT